MVEALDNDHEPFDPHAEVGRERHEKQGNVIGPNFA